MTNYDLKCLSLDGGGIKGYVQGVVLKAIPKIQYDYIAGVSAGAINACLMSVGFSPDDIMEFYSGDEGKKIFSKYFLDIPFTHRSKYDSKNINDVLLNKLNGFKLKDVKNNLIITSYDIHKRKVNTFTNLNKDQEDFYLRDIARNSSAAPYYFEPNINGEKIFIDGGLAANNPSHRLYSIIHKKCNNPLIVSIGTGTFKHPLKLEDMCYTAGINFVENLLDCFMDANSDLVDEVMKDLMGSNYVRFQPNLTEATSSLDNSSDKNIEALEEIVKEYLINDCAEKLALLK